MTSRRLLVASAAVALAAAGCGTTKIVVSTPVDTETVTLVTTLRQVRTLKQSPSTAAPEPTVYVDAMEGLLYKPETMSVGGGHQFVGHIRWMSYGGPEAIAKAVYGYDDCIPGCAGGRLSRSS